MNRRRLLATGAVSALALPARSFASGGSGALQYAEITASVHVSHTLAQGADVVIPGAPLTLATDTACKVEFYAQVVELPPGYYDLNLGLFEGNTIVRLLVGMFHETNEYLDVTAYGASFVTLPAGTHTYSVRAYQSPGSPTTNPATVAAGSGTGQSFPPAWYMISPV